ncbi:hypothetical protein PO909_027533 [Leuciscus waleckii]
MQSLKDILTDGDTVKSILLAFAVKSVSLLLIGVEKLIEKEIFKCPCKVEDNALLMASIFIGPAIFIFAFMYIIFRAFKYACSYCHPNNQPNKPGFYAACLIPPVVWVIILLLNGEYVACGLTDWNGVYVSDKELNISWCKPTEGTRNDLRDLINEYIHHSQIAGYILFGFSSGLVIILVFYDCYKSKKCSCCPCQCCTPRAEPPSVRQDSVETVDEGVDAPHNIPSNTAPNQSPSQGAPSPPHEETRV